MTKHQPLVVGNWKLNPGTSKEASELFRKISVATKKIDHATIVVAPPTIHIPAVARVQKPGVVLGAQDAHFEERGACTGSVSATLLSEFNVQYIIVGHSERRALGETNDQVAKKVKAVLKRRLTPVVCVGELERDDRGQFYTVVAEQLRSIFTVLSPQEMTKVVIAYEPIWAIGTGKTATPADVKEMQLFIKSTITKIASRSTAERVRLLYGGSVKESNAAMLHTEGGMQGFLVGGASLVPSEFAAILQAVK